MTPGIADITYEEVIIANPGNQDDPSTKYGRVDYIYKIGKYHVTIQQYTAFLNAIAATDKYSLYNTNMTNIPNVAGILRTGEPGNYTYSVMDNDGSSANRPITSISWFNAARFANWMSNGQPNGEQNNMTTENGAYALNGAISGASIPKNSINPNTNAAPLFYIPMENEWYKAAYYDPTLNEGAGGYYRFATRSNSIPGNTAGDAENQANFISDETGYPITHSFAFSTTVNYLTDVGAFTNSASYYNTFDQTGNAWEWITKDDGHYLMLPLRGGAYTSSPFVMTASYSLYTILDTLSPNVGVRLASPAS